MKKALAKAELKKQEELKDLGTEPCPYLQKVPFVISRPTKYDTIVKFY